MRRALLFSGGVDSLILWRTLPDDTQLLYVRTGAPYEDQELDGIVRLSQLAEAHQLAFPRVRQLEGVSLDPFALPDGHVPLRNTHLVATAASWGAEEVVIGTVAGETSPDKSRRWMRQTSRALSTAADRKVTISAPLRRRTKAANVARFLHGSGAPHADRELLLGTRSCYEPGGRCGACMACFRRWVAMTLNGISEPYTFNPAKWSGNHPDLSTAWAYLRRVPVTEWPAVLRNNIEAERAVRAELRVQEDHRRGWGRTMNL